MSATIAKDTIETADKRTHTPNTSAATTKDAIETADAYELARNPIFVNLQHKLIEKTAVLEIMRKAYLELVLAMGVDAFDTVPDRFNIRGLVAEYEELEKRLNDKL